MVFRYVFFQLVKNQKACLQLVELFWSLQRCVCPVALTELTVSTAAELRPDTACE